MKFDNKTLAATALTGLLMTAGAMADTKKAAAATTPAAEEVLCYGVNSCKGQGSCHGKVDSCSGKNGCDTAVSCGGQNSCKGKGLVKLSKKDCDAKGGKVAKQ
jgi:hypothetical protein